MNGAIGVFPELEQSPWIIQANEHEPILAFLRNNNVSPYTSSPALVRFLHASIDFAGTLPRSLIVELLRFRHFGNEDGAFLISGLPFDDRLIGPTPEDWKDLGGRQSFQTEMIAAGISAILGDVFAFSLWHNGRIIQNIVPIREHEDRQKATGWGNFLEWHIEDAFSEYRADFVVLACLRGDPGAATVIGSFRRILLSDYVRQVLRQERFTISSGDGQDAKRTKQVAVLLGDDEDPLVRFDPIYTEPEDRDREARMALEELYSGVQLIARQVTLKAGDVLIIDNARAAHGRTNFTPKYNGRDRWLQRAIVSRDLRKSIEVLDFPNRIVKV